MSKKTPEELRKDLARSGLGFSLAGRQSATGQPIIREEDRAVPAPHADATNTNYAAFDHAATQARRGLYGNLMTIPGEEPEEEIPPTAMPAQTIYTELDFDQPDLPGATSDTDAAAWELENIYFTGNDAEVKAKLATLREEGRRRAAAAAAETSTEGYFDIDPKALEAMRRATQERNALKKEHRLEDIFGDSEPEVIAKARKTYSLNLRIESALENFSKDAIKTPKDNGILDVNSLYFMTETVGGITPAGIIQALLLNISALEKDLNDAEEMIERERHPGRFKAVLKRFSKTPPPSTSIALCKDKRAELKQLTEAALEIYAITKEVSEDRLILGHEEIGNQAVQLQTKLFDTCLKDLSRKRRYDRPEKYPEDLTFCQDSAANMNLLQKTLNTVQNRKLSDLQGKIPAASFNAVDFTSPPAIPLAASSTPVNRGSPIVNLGERAGARGVKPISTDAWGVSASAPSVLQTTSSTPPAPPVASVTQVTAPGFSRGATAAIRRAAAANDGRPAGTTTTPPPPVYAVPHRRGTPSAAPTTTRTSSQLQPGNTGHNLS